MERLPREDDESMADISIGGADISIGDATVIAS